MTRTMTVGKRHTGTLHTLTRHGVDTVDTLPLWLITNNIENPNNDPSLVSLEYSYFLESWKVSK